MKEVLDWRIAKPRLRDMDIEQAYDRLFALVDALALKIDRLEVD